MAVTVRSARRDEGGTVARILEQAFREDPLVRWVLREDARAGEARRSFYDANVEEYLSLGRRVDLAEVDGQPRATAMWTPPPGAQPTPWRDRAALWGLREWSGLRRWPRFMRLVLATEARYPRFPHYYLFMIGAGEGARGRGLGAELLRPVLDECDDAAMPAYLESSNPRNLTFYWRHGFRLLEELHLGGRGAPSMWLMLREPQPRR